MTTQIQAKWAELEKGIIITLLCIQIGQVRSFIVWNLRIWRNWRTDTVILKHFHCAIVRSSPTMNWKKRTRSKRLQKREREFDDFFSHTGERVSVHFSTRSSFLLDVGCSSQSSLSSSLRCSGSVSKWPVSGSGVPEERSQSVEDRHRIRTPGREYYRRGNILHTFTRASSE